MDANSLVSLFGQEAGVPLTLGESRTVALAFESGPIVQIEHDPGLDVLHCYVVLGRFPVDALRCAALARLLLTANAFCRDTGGATLGLDSDEIILSRRLAISRADTDCLRVTVESLVTVAQDWASRLDYAPPEPRTQAMAFSMSDFGLRA